MDLLHLLRLQCPMPNHCVAESYLPCMHVFKNKNVMQNDVVCFNESCRMTVVCLMNPLIGENKRGACSIAAIVVQQKVQVPELHQGTSMGPIQ